MIELLAMWEDGWLPPDTEEFMWRTLKNSYRVERFMAIPRRYPCGGAVEQFDCVPEALETTDCHLVYLQPRNTHKGIDLQDHTHPENACYIFGRAGDNNMRHIRKESDDIVTVYTPGANDMFAIQVAPIVLWDRVRKSAA